VSQESPGQRRRFPPEAIAAIALVIICGISLYIRIYLPYDRIFVNDWVWFRETDAYWYIRNIEVLVRHFPRFNTFDPYILYPGGGVGLARPLFAWLVAGISLLVGHGAPTLHTIEVVGAYTPAILGTMTVIAMYFLGKELFNRWVGVISAALLAILPGEFLHRSLLGFTDHHVAEVLFSTVCMLFLVMAIKRARERQLSFSHLLERNWSTIGRPLVYTVLAGIFLGFYLLTWQGGLLFIFIIFVYFAIQFIVDHLTGRSTDYVCIIATPVFLITFLMLVPVLGTGGLDSLYWFSLPVAIVVPIFLTLVSRLMAARALRPVYYPLGLLALLGIGLACLHRIDPVLFQAMFEKFSIFRPGGAWLTISEMEPLTLSIAWTNFTTSFFISFISFAVLVYFIVKEKAAEKILLLVWSLVMLIAVLGQRRFGYYYAANAALLTGYLSWKVLDIAGLRKLLAKPKEVVGAVKKFKKKERKTREKAKPKTFMQPRGVWLRVIVVGIVLFFAVFFPNIGMARNLAQGPLMIMDEGWYTSCLWLRDNTPEPFGNADFYYELYPPQEKFEYPDTTYGVLSWWDYGYFIMQIGHRIPNANPGQAGAIDAAEFFTAQNETSANAIVDRLGSKYVMIDYAMVTGKFHALPKWAGSDVNEFYELFYLPGQAGQGGGQIVALYYPAYYRSLVVRLYNFDGKAVAPAASVVISYQGDATFGGEKFKIITNAWSFPTYEEAQAFVANQTSGNYRIGSPDAFASLVPLEELKSYELAYPLGETPNTTTVKIFKYRG
jgi:oligosaccharyl transferase (archaeosortase A-associated)